MTDIFDTKILCKNCNKEMEKSIVNRNGFELRAVKCSNCGDNIIHPADINSLEHYKNLRGKTFHVKLRMVGNSHAISIPKEIVEFINEQHKFARKRMDEMVRLCFEDFRKLSVMFGDDDLDDINDEDDEIVEEDDLLDREDKRRLYVKRVKGKNIGEDAEDER